MQNHNKDILKGNLSVVLYNYENDVRCVIETD